MKYTKYVEKTKTWKDRWNDIVRRTIFRDDKLRDLMMVPEKCKITQFIDKYFCEDGGGTEILTDEDVRIIYWDESLSKVSNDPHIHDMIKYFEIYVKKDVRHTATDDALQNRYDLIAERLKYLLLNPKYTPHMVFHLAQPTTTLWTKATSYSVARIAFSYTITG